MDAERYRRYARACFKLAGNINDLNTRIAMIEVARGWLRLAEERDKHEAPREAEHEDKLAS
jgi:hypothetical protein